MLDDSTLVVFQFNQSDFESNIEMLAQRLTVEEQSEVSNFKIVEQRLNFIISRCFSRILLAEFNHIAHTEISYERNKYGKPIAIDGKARELDVQFNISHANRVCLIAFGSKVNFGVDVEFIDSSIDAEEIVKAYFSKEERLYLQRFHGRELLGEFYYLWTLKEAYLKSTGVGLNAELSQISTLELIYSKTSLLNKLDIVDQNYKAAIACDDSRFKVKLLSAIESYLFINPLVEKALKH